MAELVKKTDEMVRKRSAISRAQTWTE